MKRNFMKLVSTALVCMFAVSTVFTPVSGVYAEEVTTKDAVVSSVNQDVYAVSGEKEPVKIIAENISNNNIFFSGDNAYELYVNGNAMGTDNHWADAENYHGLPLVYGKNVIAIKTVNYSAVAGNIFDLNIDGNRIVSDNNSKFSSFESEGWKNIDFDDSSWQYTTEYGKNGTKPWGFIKWIPSDSIAKWIWGNDLYSAGGFVRFTFYIEAPTTPTPTNTNTPTPTSTNTPTPTNTNTPTPTNTNTPTPTNTNTPTPTNTNTPTPTNTNTPTPTNTNTPTPTNTNTPTPTNTNTPTPTINITPAESKIKIQMRLINTGASVNMLTPIFYVYNESDSALDMKDLKIRYYYTANGDKSQSFWCDFTSIGASNVIGNFVKMENPLSNADYYIEIGFKGGNIMPGSYVQIYTRSAKSDWTNYNQIDDYSYKSTTDITDWEKVTGYINGELKWGTEPSAISTPTPTNTNTPTPTNTNTPTPTPSSGKEPIKIITDNISNNNIFFSGDNAYDLYVNGTAIGTDNHWADAENYRGLPLVYGKNVISIKTVNYSSVAGNIFDLNIDGNRIVSNSNSKFSPSESEGWKDINFDDSSWQYTTQYGNNGAKPWGFIKGIPSDSTAKWIWGNNLFSSGGFVRLTFYIEAP